MELLFLIKGVILGFSIAAPVGPMGVLCIRRTLSSGMLSGFLSGLGTATADAIYGCIAAFGVTVVSAFLLDHQSYLRLIGGLFLLYLGYKTFQSIPAEEAVKAGGKSFLGAYTSAFFLTLTNPLTILSFAAVFAGLGVGTMDGNYILAGFLVLGVFSGSMFWWLILSGMVNMLRSKFDQKRLKWINWLSGFIIGGFGILSLISSSFT
ncbi:threonine/homoserine/homoserine lactone efflux protein [Sporomusaceae bacterium BoRhaA]|uniref:LysE family translocator n=1 Tax=Pelorhabdus rhamnosifermentans TaxID=2772457 RepID=UPI001C06248A|nr:LysE family translocator [Pelorhabdus rhamnosifermentans]MBU2700192.1 threonine/homoserine/homoserine lactone efflux protein [Pelorhabdus rhamnosifermentans]